MKRLIIIIAVVAIGAAFVNDVGRYARTRYNLDEATNEVVDVAASTARDMTREQAARQAASNGAAEGIRVTAYNQDGLKVQVWTEADVEGTWVLARVTAWRKNLPAGTPYVLQNYGESVYR